MIDFIRAKQNQTPLTVAPRSPNIDYFGGNSRNYFDCKRMVEYFGATPGIFPVELWDHRTTKNESLAMTGPSSSIKVSSNEWMICGLVPSGHTRVIKGFEIKIGEAINLQIGWINGSITTNTAVSDHPSSIVLDLARGGITCNEEFEMMNNTIQNGSVVQCKKFGMEWFIDGEEITGNWKNTWEASNGMLAISGKGEWTITAVELEP